MTFNSKVLSVFDSRPHPHLGGRFFDVRSGIVGGGG